MRVRHCPLARLTKDRRGTSAIEFALVFPVLVLIMLAGIQLVFYVNATRRVELVAASISEMISQAAPPSGSTTATVNQLDLHFAYDSTMVLFPYIMKDAASKNIAWWQDIKINFAGIKFVAIPGTSCAPTADQSPCYVANVAWTSTGTTGGNYRPCTIPQLAVNNTTTPSNSTLPRSIFGPGSIIAVDVAFTFVPTFGAAFLPTLTITRSVFLQPRYASFIDYSTTNSDGIAILCPGYT